MDPDGNQVDAKPHPTPTPPNDTPRRNYILAELRCTHARLRLALLDVEAVAMALDARMITAEQAAAMLWDTEAVPYLGLHFGPNLGLAQKDAP